jgi:hypothetical protein
MFENEKLATKRRNLEITIIIQFSFLFLSWTVRCTLFHSALFLVTNKIFFVLFSLIQKSGEDICKHISSYISKFFPSFSYIYFLWASILQFSMQLLLTVCIFRYASIFKLTTSNMKFHESRYASPFFGLLLLLLLTFFFLFPIVIILILTILFFWSLNYAAFFHHTRLLREIYHFDSLSVYEQLHGTRFFMTFIRISLLLAFMKLHYLKIDSIKILLVLMTLTVVVHPRGLKPEFWNLRSHLKMNWISF